MQSTITKEWNEMLATLAERDAAVELSRRTGKNDAPPMISRSRVFEVEADGCIVVEKPPRLVTGQTFKNDDDIELTLMHNNVRLVATCTVQQVFMYQVNATMRLACYRLSPGRRPQREQRRSFFRVNLAAMDLGEAELKSSGDSDPTEYSARIVNLSGGGMGVFVRASRSILNQIKKKRELECTSHFDDGDKLVVPVHVAHVEAIGDEGLYLGLEFAVENEHDANVIRDRMLQRSVEYQRQILKRRRA